MDAKISVIVPIYNAEKTLRRCADALLKQTYQNIEIILVDDGSKDRSLEICQQYAAQDNRVKAIHKSNGGVSSARNAGLDVADGDFVMFCDSDDWAEPDWCAELISHYEPGCLVMCGQFIEGEQPYFPHEVCSKGKIEHYPKTEFYKLKLRFFTSPWNKIYERAVILDNNINFDINISNGEDYLFNLHYLSVIKGDIICLTKCTFHYVWPKETNLSTKVDKNYFGESEHWAKKLLEIGEAVSAGNEDCIHFLYAEIFSRYQRGIFLTLNSKGFKVRKMRRINSIMRSTLYRECIAVMQLSNQNKALLLWSKRNCILLYLWIHFRNRKKMNY